MGKEAKKMEAHPFAELLPLMSFSELQSLERHIALNGQEVPIKLFEGKILDGRNRYIVCEKLGLKPVVENFSGTRAQALHYVYAQSNRRNLNDSQKAIAALGFKPHFAALAKDRMHNGRKTVPEGDKGDARDFAGNLFGVSGRYVDDAQRIRDASPDLFQQVFEGEISLSAARVRVQRLEQLRHVNRLSKSAKLARSEQPKILIGDNIEQMRGLKDSCARVIFADPNYNNGWRYDADPNGDSGSVGILVAIVRYASLHATMMNRNVIDVDLLKAALSRGLTHDRAELLLARIQERTDSQVVAKAG